MKIIIAIVFTLVSAVAASSAGHVGLNAIQSHNVSLMAALEQ